MAKTVFVLLEGYPDRIQELHRRLDAKRDWKAGHYCLHQRTCELISIVYNEVIEEELFQDLNLPQGQAPPEKIAAVTELLRQLLDLGPAEIPRDRKTSLYRMEKSEGGPEEIQVNAFVIGTKGDLYGG